jgi:hypothetical protein
MGKRRKNDNNKKTDRKKGSQNTSRSLFFRVRRNELKSLTENPYESYRLREDDITFTLMFID